MRKLKRMFVLACDEHMVGKNRFTCEMRNLLFSVTKSKKRIKLKIEAKIRPEEMCLRCELNYEIFPCFALIV